VLARVFGIEKDISSAESKSYFFKFANELISTDHPGDFNQAVMEFGATWCTPQNPKCEECIFRKTCVAFALNAQNILPVKTKKAKIKKRYLYYLVFHHDNKVVLQKREGKDIWYGLYDFHSIESARPLTPQKIIGSNAAILKTLGKIKNLLFISFSKLNNIGKAVNKFQIVGNSLRHACLLKNYFR